MERRPPQSIDALRGIEGRVAQAYFTSWRSIPLRWEGLGRKPIPEEWHYVGPRVRPNSKRNKGATHPISTMLNYGYAVLESQVQIAVIASGLDPTIGFMHSHGDRRSALVLDLMEPIRPVVDGVVLGLARQHTFSPLDFMLREDGVCRLSRQLARCLVDRVAKDVEPSTYIAAVCDVVRRSAMDNHQKTPCHDGLNNFKANSSRIKRFGAVT
jgi:CRISPR-associated endonuclease Cas1